MSQGTFNRKKVGIRENIIGSDPHARMHKQRQTGKSMPTSGGRTTGKGRECVDFDDSSRKRRIPLASTFSETQCVVDEQGRPRCFCITEPKKALEPRPVIVMHHGHGAEGARFCVRKMRLAAAVRGVVLVCTSALNGSWQLPHITSFQSAAVAASAGPFGSVVASSVDPIALAGALPISFDGCQLSRSPDLAYVSSIMDFLRMHPRRFDSRRVFQAGFSQGAIFAAYATFCLRRLGVPISGFAQSGGSFLQGLQHYVAPTRPPLRVCIWCRRDILEV